MKRILTILIASLLVLSFGAGNAFAEGQGEEAQQEVELLYVEWAGEIAATYTAQVVLEEMGYDVTVTSVSAAAMWEGIASGDGEGMLAAWLPGTHGEYRDQTEDRLEVLDDGDPVMPGARIGLMVPTYVDIDTIPELEENADMFDNEIVGIDPGAGIMSATENAIDTYNLESLELVEGSGATMVSALESAYENEEPVVVTGWTPHYKEAMFDLKYLEDPEGVYGETENVYAVARDGLEEEMPEVYEFLNNFNWTVDDFGDLMLDNREGDPYENAQDWVEDNRDIVETWIP